MQQKKLDIEVELSEIAEEPLYKGASLKGTAKVFVKDFGIRLNLVPWQILDGKILVTFVSWEKQINGQAKHFPIVHFLDKKTDKQIRNAIKNEIEPQKKRLEQLALEAKKRKKERVKLKKKQKRFNELRAFLLCRSRCKTKSCGTSGENLIGSCIASVCACRNARRSETKKSGRN